MFSEEDTMDIADAISAACSMVAAVATLLLAIKRGHDG